jgi:hypothetical protein
MLSDCGTLPTMATVLSENYEFRLETTTYFALNRTISMSENADGCFQSTRVRENPTLFGQSLLSK